MNQQVTNTVHNWIKTYVLLEAINQRLTFSDRLITIDELSELGDEIKSRALRGEIVTQQQRLELADYVLRYHVNFREIAQGAFDTIDTAAGLTPASHDDDEIEKQRIADLYVQQAAPELLEALIQLKDFLASTDMSEEAQDKYNLACAVIAKAKGES